MLFLSKIKVDDLREEYEKFEKKDLVEEVIDKVLEIDKLKRKLRRYENPHTPSSKQGFDKPQAEGLKVGRKPGKKSNHQGATREMEKPTVVVPVTALVNPLSGSKNIVRTGEYEERIIVDFKIEKTVTLYKVFYYRDRDTGEVFAATHPDLPEKGVFGKSTIALANTLHYEYRVPVDGVAKIFTHAFDISMTAPTALDLCNRAAQKVEAQYNAINDELRKSEVVNADETGSNQNGKSEWLWGFFTLTLAFFVFFKQRGGEIVENVLGKDFRGIIGCDGWSTYKVFSEKYGILLQRCWAHLLREVKYTCKGVQDLNAAYVWICDIFDGLKKARALKTYRMRKQQYDVLVAELDSWVQVYGHYTKMRDLVTKVKNGKNYWFTCVLYPEVEPTNNRAERGIRKFVILEKIMGCLRSEQGKKTTQIMLSLFGTWRLQGLNPYKELRSII